MNFNLNYSGDLFANNANTVKVQAYTVSNFRLSYNISKRNWKILPYLGINNIFDTEFSSNIRINAYARDRNLSYDSGESLNQKRIGLVYERDHSSGLLTVRNYYVTRDFSNKLPFKNG